MLQNVKSHQHSPTILKGPPILTRQQRIDQHYSSTEFLLIGIFNHIRKQVSTSKEYAGLWTTFLDNPVQQLNARLSRL
jgi:hypothetical protein